jgi:hypothetical protein
VTTTTFSRKARRGEEPRKRGKTRKEWGRFEVLFWGELGFFEVFDGLVGRGEDGGVGEEDGEVVFDGVLEVVGGEEEVAFAAELFVGDGADEEVEKGVVHESSR